MSTPNWSAAPGRVATERVWAASASKRVRSMLQMRSASMELSVDEKAELLLERIGL
jgi:hypothetical protein